MVRYTEFEEHDVYPAPRRAAPEFEDDFRRRVVIDRSPPRREDRGVPFLREEARRAEAGPMVLRRREVEKVERRSPSPTRFREREVVRRPRSASAHAHGHEHERTRSRTRFIEKERVRESPPRPVPVRYVERPREPSPAAEKERIRIRDRRRESSSSSSSASPSPPPSKVRAPTIEREVVTHYRGVDHGTVKARPRVPSRQRSFARERETDIDISLTKDRTSVDVVRKEGRARSKSHERRSGRDELVVYRDKSRPRAHSAGPLHAADAEEAAYLESKIDARGRMGEARHGATRDWTLVDVPPGTERIRMDGAGGGGTDTTYSKYSGARRTEFVADRDEEVRTPRRYSPERAWDRERETERVWDREREIDIERTVERKPKAPSRDMWTEVSKDMVSREAIEYMGYDYEEGQGFYYIVDYVPYDNVLRLIDLSEDLRRNRRERVHEIEWERERERERGGRHHHHHHWQRPLPHHHHEPWEWDEIREREVDFIEERPIRGYLH